MDVHQTRKHFKAIILISHNNAEKSQKAKYTKNEKSGNIYKKWEIHIVLWSSNLNPDALSSKAMEKVKCKNII